MNDVSDLVRRIEEKAKPGSVTIQRTADGVPTVWIDAADVLRVMAFLKSGIEKPYRMLYDLTAIDERTRAHREGQPGGDFTVVYHLYSLDRNEYLRVKTALAGERPSVATITGIWPNANWYEREIWDMFGIAVEGHPLLKRILMPEWWEGHPLRKDHPARATDMEPFRFPQEAEIEGQEKLRFDPAEWGMAPCPEGAECMILNMGPQHPGTHGLLRLVLELDGETIVDAAVDIGFHHRGAEKMGERQTWHTFIPYTDRIDYLGGAMNNLPYVLAVEKLAGIEVPPRAQVIRVMLCELFRIISHLVWYGTFGQDLGLLSPIFYMFSDRERAFDIVSAITGGRMHPSWFRIGGVGADLPEGWDRMVKEFLDWMPPRLGSYDTMIMQSRIFKARTVGVGACTAEEAIDWGMTGPNLRACGIEYDFRKKTPYSGYEHFDFDIPTGRRGDCYDRGAVRVEEMRQSLRIIRQCLENMPSGPYQSSHELATPPRKDRALEDIETLITHFLNVTWGPPIPPGEALAGIEATKGATGYYLVSDGGGMSYRTRIRTPSFPHMQMLPLINRGSMVADLIAVLGSIDFVLADVDR
jgi:NADH-quinone oxidoreductase subunit C/D